MQGVLNVGTGSSVSLLQLIDTMAQAIHAVPVVRHEPSAPGDIPHSATTTTRLTQALGWQPSTPLLDGLAALAHSLRAG